jgi:hypothetical protein
LAVRENALPLGTITLLRGLPIQSKPLCHSVRATGFMRRLSDIQWHWSGEPNTIHLNCERVERRRDSAHNPKGPSGAPTLVESHIVAKVQVLKRALASMTATMGTCRVFCKSAGLKHALTWWARWDSNPRPRDYESAGKRSPAGTRHGSPWLRRTLLEATRPAARTKGTYCLTQ